MYWHLLWTIVRSFSSSCYNTEEASPFRENVVALKRTFGWDWGRFWYSSSLGLGLMVALGLLGRQHWLHVGQDAALPYGDFAQKFVELLSVVDGQLHMAWDVFSCHGPRCPPAPGSPRSDTPAPQPGTRAHGRTGPNRAQLPLWSRQDTRPMRTVSWPWPAPCLLAFCVWTWWTENPLSDLALSLFFLC